MEELEWETSRDFDKLLETLGKNRKLIILKFKEIEDQNKEISIEKAKEILSSVLDNYQIKISEKNWKMLLSFCIKNNAVDYYSLMNIFKIRQKQLNSHSVSNMKDTF